ncbi:hypothetical protein AKJ53_01055 [candidate division MSBL1 archaeon SCGC-AAA382F02]|uniref:PIN domain-containing protein n=1 Tax=candidate division MSBL1 archaeon SCGC-AAA382F02 TaxID=1698282 RepID=A0A133VIB7_9EURY|nr:hypothetical protein AKJ53_01055 [candidate division MSBL1 archaeon SCGC-AAA382F02]
MEDLWIILDANFLMIPESYGVDIFSELERIVDKKYEIVIPEVVIGELKNLEKQGTASEQKSAKIALELASRGKIVNSEKKEADEEIIRLAKEKDCLVGTNDSILKKRLQELGIPIIYLRQKSHLTSSREI